MFKRKKFNPTEPPARWLNCPRKATEVIVGNWSFLYNLLSDKFRYNLMILSWTVLCHIVSPLTQLKFQTHSYEYNDTINSDLIIKYLLEKFLAFKVPLSTNFDRNVPIECRFNMAMLIDSFKRNSYNVGSLGRVSKLLSKNCSRAIFHFSKKKRKKASALE